LLPIKNFNLLTVIYEIDWNENILIVFLVKEIQKSQALFEKVLAFLHFSKV
jgi:hypothetical protein